MDLYTLLVRAATGAFAGITFAFTGIGKSPGEAVDWFKMTKTGILGAIVGIGSEFTGMPMISLQTYLLDAGVTALIENGLKALWRRVIKKKQ
jgi:hypothetical protein